MAISLTMMAVSFSFATLETGADGQQVAQLDAPWSLVALIFANAFVVGFGASWGPLVWVLLGEMFPNRIRAAALSVAAAAQWVANFFISTTFPAMADIGLTFAYGFYATFAALSFFFVFFKIPETKGRELEDMNEETSVRRKQVKTLED